MNVILFDNNRSKFYPLSFTRPISYFRFGILTIKEKWEQFYSSVSVKTEKYLSKKFQENIQNDNLWIDATVIPSKSLISELNNLRNGEGLEKNGEIFAFRNNVFDTNRINIIGSNAQFFSLNHLVDLFIDNEREINNDFRFLKKHKKSYELDSNNTIIGDNIFVEKGAKVTCSILNSENGPIYIGQNAEIMEGSIVRGPFAICDNSTLKIGSKIYGATTIGPFCKVGGEINNSVFFGFSSKAHDGFLGNSIIGEWCNIGADTNTSNLKNNYTEVKLWDYNHEKFINTGLLFCGLIMGDHSKCGINTMFNTGTVVGTSANIFGSGFPRNFIPSFSWGGNKGFSTFKLAKVFSIAEQVFKRRRQSFEKLDEDILTHVFDMTKRYRKE